MGCRKFGCKIKLARINKGLSREELATLLDVSKREIRMWEHGRIRPDSAYFNILKGILELGEFDKNIDNKKDKALGFREISANILYNWSEVLLWSGLILIAIGVINGIISFFI